MRNKTPTSLKMAAGANKEACRIFLLYSGRIDVIIKNVPPPWECPT